MSESPRGRTATAGSAALVRGLEERAAVDSDAVGGKAANLGELIRAGFQVPPGFVVPAPVYLDAMARAGVREQLDDLHRRAMAAVDDPAELEELCARAAAAVRS